MFPLTVGESFYLARGSFGPDIFVSDFFWRQSLGFLALQVEGLLAHIVTVLVTYHTYTITMMATTLSTMIGNNGVSDAMTAPPPRSTTTMIVIGRGFFFWPRVVPQGHREGGELLR